MKKPQWPKTDSKKTNKSQFLVFAIDKTGNIAIMPFRFLFIHNNFHCIMAEGQPNGGTDGERTTLDPMPYQKEDMAEAKARLMLIMDRLRESGAIKDTDPGSPVNEFLLLLVAISDKLLDPALTAGELDVTKKLLEIISRKRREQVYKDKLRGAGQGIDRLMSLVSACLEENDRLEKILAETTAAHHEALAKTKRFDIEDYEAKRFDLLAQVVELAARVNKERGKLNILPDKHDVVVNSLKTAIKWLNNKQKRSRLVDLELDFENVTKLIDLIQGILVQAWQDLAKNVEQIRHLSVQLSDEVDRILSVRRSRLRLVAAAGLAVGLSPFAVNFMCTARQSGSAEKPSAANVAGSNSAPSASNSNDHASKQAATPSIASANTAPAATKPLTADKQPAAFVAQPVLSPTLGRHLEDDYLEEVEITSCEKALTKNGNPFSDLARCQSADTRECVIKVLTNNPYTEEKPEDTCWKPSTPADEPDSTFGY